MTDTSLAASPAAVRQDQQLVGRGVRGLTCRPPPPVDRADRELRRVV